MPRINFKGRGWDTSTGEGKLNKSNVAVLSQHCHIHAGGNVKKLICRCRPDLAPERGCRGSCSCWKRGKKLCSPEACGCKGRCGRVSSVSERASPVVSMAHGDAVEIDRAQGRQNTAIQGVRRSHRKRVGEKATIYATPRTVTHTGIVLGRMMARIVPRIQNRACLRSP